MASISSALYPKFKKGIEPSRAEESPALPRRYIAAHRRKRALRAGLMGGAQQQLGRFVGLGSIWRSFTPLFSLVGVSMLGKRYAGAGGVGEGKRDNSVHKHSRRGSLGGISVLCTSMVASQMYNAGDTCQILLASDF